MKKIAYVITDLSYGGAQTMLLHLLKNIDKRKYKIEVFIRESELNTSLEKSVIELGIPCHYLCLKDNDYSGLKLLHKLKCYRRFEKEMKTYNPDIVHSHLESFYSTLYCILNRKKYIFTAHSFPDRIMTRQFKAMLKVLNYQKHLQIIGCAQCVSDRIVEIMGKNFQSVTNTIYNPIELNEYKNIPQREGKIFIHVGRLDPIKNQTFLIETFAKFAKEYPETKLVIVGDGVLMKSLLNLVHDLKMDRNIIFLGNRVDINELLAKADCFVLTSKSECCPMSILEAMASGIPIISTNVGGIKEITKDACLFINNKTQLFEALKVMYLNADKRLLMGSIAKKYAKDYDSLYITEQYMRYYI